MSTFQPMSNSRLDPDQKQLIELQGLPFEQFIDRLIPQFGPKITKFGFELIRLNKQFCFQENSEDLYKDLFQKNGIIFESEEQASQFIDQVSSYIIISNMNL